MIQADTVNFGEVYAYTFIDTYTREASVVIKASLSSIDGKAELQEAMRKFGKVNLIQTDGGSEFEKEFILEAKNILDNIELVDRIRRKSKVT